MENGHPKRNCGLKDGHPQHQNITPVDGTWCDGVPPLEPFVELTVRASVHELFGDMSLTHEQALCMLSKYGLGLLVDCIDKPDTARVLRVRTGDGQDRVYPIIHSTGAGLTAVVMNDDTGD